MFATYQGPGVGSVWRIRGYNEMKKKRSLTKY